jgi:hypothetical protein
LTQQTASENNEGNIHEMQFNYEGTMEQTANLEVNLSELRELERNYLQQRLHIEKNQKNTGTLEEEKDMGAIGDGDISSIIMGM